MLRQQLLDTSRGRIVTALQRGASTVDDLATRLDLTANAVRAQLTAMERDGVVQRAGLRPGTTRPAHVYELTAEVEQLLSQAYGPFVMQLVRVFSEALPAKEIDRLMREVGKGLAAELPAPRGARTFADRVKQASELLNQQLGAITHVEKSSGYIIRGVGCPLAALTGKHPAVCLAMESLLTEAIGASVHECCNREGRPKCCFEIKAPPDRSPTARS